MDAPQSVEEILVHYPDMFKDELGLLKGHSATLSIDNAAASIFCNLRPHVSFALREEVDQELDRILDFRITQPIQYSH